MDGDSNCLTISASLINLCYDVPALPLHCKSEDYLISGAFDKEDGSSVIYLNVRRNLMLSKDQKM